MLSWNSKALLSSFLLFTLPAHAALNWDDFIAQEKMPAQGKYKGQLVENGQRRALKLLTANQKAELGLDSKELVFANFRHNGTFFIAKIPGIVTSSSGKIIGTQNVVSRVVLSEKHWAGKIREATRSVEAHAELVFYPTKGNEIRLIANQDRKQILPKPQILNDAIVLSVEAVRSVDDVKAPFFPNATGPNFAIVHRIVSNHERNMQHRDDPDREIDSNKLKFDQVSSKKYIGAENRASEIQNPMDALLVTAILRSELKGRKETYGIVTKNCTNSLFQLLDDVLIYKAGIDKAKIRKGILRFVKNDLPKIVNYLEEQKKFAEQERAIIDPALNAGLEKIKKYVEKDLTDAEIDESFMSSLPAFIKPHLKARALLAE